MKVGILADDRASLVSVLVVYMDGEMEKRESGLSF